MIGSKELIRSINSRIVLEAIIKEKYVSRAELSKKLGLTKATISSIVQELIDSKLVIETGSADTSVGRKPIILQINKYAGYSVSVVLTEQCIMVMVNNIAGDMECFKSVPFDKGDNVVKAISSVVDDFVSNAKRTRYGVIGVTISSELAENNNGELYIPNCKDIEEDISKIYNCPVYICNSFSLFALGEKMFSKDYESLAAIYADKNVGLGIIIDQVVYEGYKNAAGQLGNTIINTEGKTLKSYISTQAVLKRLSELKNGENITFDKYCQYCSDSDKDAITVSKEFADAMYLAIVNVINLFSSEAVVIYSPIIKAFPDILEYIKGRIGQIYIKNVFISKLNESAMLYGAAYINITKFLGIINFNPHINNK